VQDDVNRLARELVHKYGGEKIGLLWRTRESMSEEEFNRLMDAVLPEWRSSAKKTAELYVRLRKKAGTLADRYADGLIDERYVEGRACFALGFQTAIALLGL
jgi:hypothetical protein